jgi:hypothetical protein
MSKYVCATLAAVAAIGGLATAASAATFTGMVGVGTWNTQADFANVKVTQGNTTLYQSNFAAGMSEWTVKSGTWITNSSGYLHQSSSATPALALVGSTSWTNYTVTLQARKTGGAEGFLIAFGSPGDSTWTWWNIGGWGDTLTAIQAPNVLTPSAPMTIQTNVWYNIQITVQGDEVKCYLNGTLIHDAYNDTHFLRGMNWPDPSGSNTRDAQPNGIDSSMTASQAAGVATTITNAAKASGALTLRLPINQATTSDPSWWPVYQAVINAVVSDGCNVLLTWWASSGGVVNNGTDTTASWQAMWDAVDAVYKNNNHVFYEPINEPYGYSNTDLNNLYAGFLSRYSPANGKCILDGAGYAQYPSVPGGDSRLNSQYIGFHAYHWFFTVSNDGDWSQWYNVEAGRVGSALAPRTVMTEMGVGTLGGYDYFWQWQQGVPKDVAFLTGSCAYVHDNSMGSIAWSGIDTDSYRWFTASNNLVEMNSGIANMYRWSWGVPNMWQQAIPNGVYNVQNRGDGSVIDGLGFTANGSPAGQWQSSGSPNQQWDISYGNGVYTLQNFATNMCLDTGGNTANGSSLQQWPNNWSVSNQHWSLAPTDSGYYQMINQASGVCIDTGGLTYNGATLQLWNPDTSYNQQWTFASTQPIANGNHTLTPQNATGSCLDANGWGTSNGTKVQIWQSNGGGNQSWSFTSAGGNVYRIQPSYDSALCLDVNGAGTTNGTIVDLWACVNQTNQLWSAFHDSGNVYEFAPQNAIESRLDVYGAGTANGTQVEIWQTAGSANQKWAVN